MSSIGGIGSNTSMMMRGMNRPSPQEMADKLFSQLDTSGSGSLQKSDFQKIIDAAASGSSADSSSSASSLNLDEVFSQLDGNGDGQVTKQEFSDTFSKLAEQLDSQFNSMRMQGGMPPPPPEDGGSAQDAGFTQDELSAQLKDIGSTDSKRSTLISNVVANFDKADTNGDGKVSATEAMALEQSTNSSSSTQGSTSADSTSSSASDLNLKAMMQALQLIQAYALGNDSQKQSRSVSLSV